MTYTTNYINFSTIKEMCEKPAQSLHNNETARIWVIDRW